ncbi:MAG: mannose-1-phosphate guanylyltransferase [Candidatus Sumerlaeia bacterium]|nr:mannose-1-phosphate guanylyltransferase [Candidatus Sumerlaeia bacterium]
MATRIAVIMAGGAGERFWPLSRRYRPKQLLCLLGGRTMLEESAERIAPLVSWEHLFVATGTDQAPYVAQVLPQLPTDHILREPMGRDTAACMALALAWAGRLGGDATMAVMTADHCIGRNDRFQADCLAAFEQAEADDVLVTFGIQPTRPETGYGYIELGECVTEQNGTSIYEVRRFCEKPDAATAQKFLDAGRFVWNSGMFVWRCSVLREALRVHAPWLGRASEEMAAALGQGDEVQRLRAIFERLPKTSIDYAVMEHARNVRCVRATFEWDDVGTWTALARHHPADTDGNTVLGEAVLLETTRSIIYNQTGDSRPAPLIAALGVSDLVIVATDDAILVCHRDQAHRIKEIVERAKALRGGKYC